MFLYAFVSSASISFPHLFLRSLNEVHRNFAKARALIHPIFIHRILLFLGLADFPIGEPVHVIAPLVVTFLRQRAALLRVGPTRHRGASSGVVPPPPSFIRLRCLVLLLLMVIFLHRLLQMIQKFNVR